MRVRTDRYLKQWATGEGVPLMRCSGSGDVYFAYLSKDVQLLYLQNEGITLNGSNVLAMESTLAVDIAMVQGAAGVGHHGLFNVVIGGTGWVAMTSSGTPLVMQVTPGSSTYADPDAAIAWSTQLHVSVQAAVSLVADFPGMFGGDHGESCRCASRASPASWWCSRAQRRAQRGHQHLPPTQPDGRHDGRHPGHGGMGGGMPGMGGGMGEDGGTGGQGLGGSSLIPVSATGPS